MLLDARRLDQVPSEMRTQVAVVGGGTVGLFLAVTLARSGVPVVVVEAGGTIPDPAATGRTAVSVGRPYEGVRLGRSFGLGGTSVLWGGQLAELESSDLTSNGIGWPLAFEELRRWYDDVYRALGIRVGTTDHYRTLFGKEKYDPADGVERYFTHWLPQPNFAALFRKEITTDANPIVIVNAVAKDIAFEGGAARTLQASVEERLIQITADHFVFAAGTIETCRFFLTTQRLSHVPWKTSPYIGSYFQDHLAGKLADLDISDQDNFRDYFENGFVGPMKLQPKLRFVSRDRVRFLSGVAGSFSFTSRLQENVANIKMVVRSAAAGRAYSNWRNLPSDLRALGGAFLPLALRYLRQRRIFAFFEGGVELHAQLEQLPVSKSRITLQGDTPQADGLFRAAVDWHVEGREIEALRAFAERTDAYLQRRRIGQLRVASKLLAGDPAFLATFSDTYHHCGGMRMASRATDGVVDASCRVWNTENVHVAGACVFPTSGSANCTLTALALAARLADTLAASISRQSIAAH